MLSRIRVEASAKTEREVKDELIAAAQLVIAEYPGQWKEEDDALQVQTSSHGFWGRYTLRRERE